MAPERGVDSDGRVVELADITLERGETCILSGISWSIEHGRHWVLLGANGSGKTTLLKVVTGYEWPTQGTVTVLGQRYGQCHLPSLRTRIGWVSAAIAPRFPAWNSALDIVVSGFAASLGVYRDFSEEEWETARQTLRSLGAAQVAERPYRLLSQGEQQRVLIARGLVHKPALMILDEPCAGLDPAARETFIEDLGMMAASEDAPTLIMVTHHIEEIGPWIENVLVLSEGRQVAAGPTAAALTDEAMTKAFGRPCTVTQEASRFRLSMPC